MVPTTPTAPRPTAARSRRPAVMGSATLGSATVGRAAMGRAVLGSVTLAAIVLLGACGGSDEVFAVPEARPGEAVELNSGQAATLLDSDDQVVVVDVRTTEEYVGGHLVGAQNISIEDDEIWEQRVSALDREQPIAVYCRTGRRSAEAAQRLVDAGFTSVYDLGGVEEWDSDDLQVDKAEPSTPVDQ